MHRRTPHLAIPILAVLSAAASAIFWNGGIAQASGSTSSSGILVTPESGNYNQSLTVDTSHQCGSGTRFVAVLLSGPGLAADTELLASVAYNEENAPLNDMGGFHLVSTNTFADVFGAQNITAPDGAYRIVVACRGTSDGPILYPYDKRLRFTTSGGTTTFEQVEPVVPTVTIAPDVESPVVYDPNHSLRFTATLNPSEAKGVVDFMTDGRQSPYSGTVVPAAVVDDWLPLKPGTHNVQARFTQTNWVDYRPSISSAVTYVVAGPTTIAGTPRVGETLTCAGVSGATRTFSWTLDGTPIPGLTSSAAAVRPAWASHKIGCAIKTADADSSVTVPSPERRVTLAAAPVASTRPAANGVARVGRFLDCSPGSWTPASGVYSFAWKRDGHLIAGAHGRTRKNVRVDRGHRISCVVTSRIAGHKPGIATSPSRAVRR